jgi:hypothetical protein
VVQNVGDQKVRVEKSGFIRVDPTDMDVGKFLRGAEVTDIAIDDSVSIHSLEGSNIYQ